MIDKPTIHIENLIGQLHVHSTEPLGSVQNKVKEILVGAINSAKLEVDQKEEDRTLNGIGGTTKLTKDIALQMITGYLIFHGREPIKDTIVSGAHNQYGYWTYQGLKDFLLK